MTPEPPVRRSARRETLARSRLWFRFALVASIASLVAPILSTRYLPFTDAPEHAAVMATLRRWGDPVFAEPYVLALGRSQYVVYHLTGAALTWLTNDAELANRLLVAGVAIAFPVAFGALLRAASRDERLALLACLPFLSRPLVLGFLPFVASIPIACFGLALVFRIVRRRGRDRWRAAGLAALAVVLFYTHVSSWMLFVAATAVVAVLARRPRVLLLLAPSAVAACAWFAVGQLTLRGESLADAGEIGRMSVTRSMLSMPAWIFDVWRARGDEVAAALWWTGFIVVVLASARSMARYSRRALALLYAPLACAVVIYLVTPWRVGAALMLNVRLAPILVLFALLPLRLRLRSRAVHAAMALTLVANLVGGVTALRQCRAARAELGDLDLVLDAVRPGARLLTLNFDGKSDITHVFPWPHVGSYHRVRGGGVAGFSFSELRHWPLQYAASERPPVKTSRRAPCSRASSRRAR